MTSSAGPQATRDWSEVPKAAKVSGQKLTDYPDRRVPSTDEPGVGVEEAKTRQHLDGAAHRNRTIEMIKAVDVAAGAIGGLAGALAMTAFMTVAKRAGIISTPLPERVERWVVRRAGFDRGPSGLPEEVLAQGGHLLFGSALGAVYGALSSAFRLRPIPAGPLYGAALFALDLGALGPAMGVTKPLQNEPAMTNARRLMMHVVFGTVTGLVTDRLRQHG